MPQSHSEYKSVSYYEMENMYCKTISPFHVTATTVITAYMTQTAGMVEFNSVLLSYKDKIEKYILPPFHSSSSSLPATKWIRVGFNSVSVYQERGWGTWHDGRHRWAAGRGQGDLRCHLQSCRLRRGCGWGEEAKWSELWLKLLSAFIDRLNDRAMVWMW